MKGDLENTTNNVFQQSIFVSCPHPSTIKLSSNGCWLQVRLHQCASRDRAEPPRRHGEFGLRPHVLQQREPALAGAQGRNQEAEVREN